MLVKFPFDYDPVLNQGSSLVGDIVSAICKKEPFMGATKTLDVLYARSVLISALIDYIESDNGSNEKLLAGMLETLKTAIDKTTCSAEIGIVDHTNYHIKL